MTPNIDRVLRGRFQQRRTEGGEKRAQRGGGASSSGTTTAHGEEGAGEYELRLMQLEKQLSELLQKSKVEPTTMLCVTNDF